MSKVHESPVKRFPGSVTTPDELTYLQGMAYGKAYRQAKALGKEVSMPEFIYAMLPGLVACVEEWHIEGLPEQVTIETLQATKPARAVAQLMGWLFTLCTRLWVASEELPNASGPIP